MEFIIQFLKWLLPVRNSTKPIEERLFEITLFLTVMTMLVWSVVGIFSGYTWFIQGVYLFAASFYFSLYAVIKKGKSFATISVIYYVTALLLIALGWLPSGGIKGAVMHMCVLVYLSGLMVLPLRWYVIFMASTLSVVIFFVCLEFYHPTLPVPYLVEGELYRDLSIAGLLMLTLMGIAFYIFKKEYLGDRTELKIANQKLENEKLKAETSDRAKTRFLTSISHGMRTPLNGIVATTELLSNTPLDDDQRELVQNLTQSNNALKELIAGVLDISAIENHQMSLQRVDFDLQEMLDSFPGLFKYALDEKKGRVLFTVNNVKGQTVRVCGDLAKIKQVISSLVSNAIRFTDAGAVKLRVEVGKKSADEVTVLVSVEDTGCGIPADIHHDIFRPYFVSENQQRVEGPGLGLFIAKSLTELMGGKIWFTSVENTGSTFFAEWPLTLSNRKEIGGEGRQAYAEDFSELRVLIAEDVQINRLVLTKILKKLGIVHVEVVEDGAAAVEKALSQTFDFVLMDVQMPKMDGISASKKINSAFGEKGMTPPVIVAVTANAMKEDEAACLAAGMKGFITKPFTSNELFRVLSTLRR